MNNKNELTTWKTVCKMFLAVKQLLPFIAIAVFFAVLGFLMTIIIPSIIVYLGWMALNGQIPSFWWLLTLIVCAICRGLFRYLEHYFGHYVAFHTLANFRRLIFRKLRNLAPAHLDKQNSGSLLKMIGEDIEAMEVFFAHTIPPISTAVIVTVILMVYYVSVSPQVAIIAFVTYSVLAIVLPYFFARQLQPLIKEQTILRQDYVSQFLESLNGMKELIQFNISEKQFHVIEEKSKLVNGYERKVAKRNTLQTLCTFLVIGFAILIVASLLLNAVMKNELQLFDATLLIIVFCTSFAPYLELSRLPLGFKRAIHAGQNVFQLLDTKENDKSGLPFNGTMKDVTLNAMSFAYDNREHSIFEDVNFTFGPHKIIGLVGSSGSGKSTLMKLIMRWYDVTEGDIQINNQIVSTLSAQSIQRKIAYIPQVPQFFNQTLRENLTFGNSEISDAMIMDVAQKCRIADKIAMLKNGLDTQFDNENTIFSAGELQRLELTRALLKNADCYIFDEPTSNLDSLNEAAFLHVIREHCKGKVFLISHRNSTVSCADIIYRVENKKIYEV